MSPLKRRQAHSTLKFFLISGLVAIGIIAFKQFDLLARLQVALIWSDLGKGGAISFIAIYNLATLLFVPGSLLTLQGGFLFGFFRGSVYVLIAAMIGATSAFLLGRTLTKDWVCKQMRSNPQFQLLDRAVTQEGWKIVFLTRLSPLFPFNLLNYAFGVTQISLKDYVLGSFGMIPGTIMYVYIGSLARDLATLDLSPQLTTEAQVIQWLLRIIGLIATVAVTLYLSRLAKQALDQR